MKAQKKEENRRKSTEESAAGEEEKQNKRVEQARATVEQLEKKKQRLVGDKLGDKSTPVEIIT